MVNLRGIINRVVGGGPASAGPRTGGTPGPGPVGGPGTGTGTAGGHRSSDEALGRGLRGLLGRFGGRR